MAVTKAEGDDSRRNLLLLATIYTAYSSIRTGSAVVLPLTAKTLLQSTLGGAEYSTLYQLPYAVWLLTDVLIAGPIAYLMHRHGRRSIFMLGAACCLAGSFVAFGILRYAGMWPRLAFSMWLMGLVLLAGTGVGEFVRYAAPEAAREDERNRTVSLVLCGGGVMSALGPLCSSLASSIQGDDAVELYGYSYFFLFAAGFSLTALVSACLLRLPAPEAAMSTDPGSYSALCRPEIMVAIVCQFLVQFAMVGPSAGLPLAMGTLLGLEHGTWLISGCAVVHVFCMFAPGFASGAYIQRLGTRPCMFGGVCVMSFGLILGILSVETWAFYVCLALVGLGWHVAFIASTLLLVRVDSAELAKASSVNETLRFLANAVAALLSATWSWYWLLVACLLSCLAAMAVVCIQALWETRARAKGAADVESCKDQFTP